MKLQWQRNGKAIRGATGTTYKLVANDNGTKVRAVITASKAGYATQKATTVAKRVG